jgi:DnaJ-class molecular chaperone
MPAVDTKDWKLAATLDYKCKTEPTYHNCDYCGGSGTVGGGFKSLDGPEDCPRCFGTGGSSDYSHIEPKPAIPRGLIDHMRKSYQEYLAMPEVENEDSTCCKGA